jgi:hypothetical protein
MRGSVDSTPVLCCAVESTPSPSPPQEGGFDAIVVDATPRQTWGISDARVAALQASMAAEGSHLK